MMDLEERSQSTDGYGVVKSPVQDDPDHRQNSIVKTLNIVEENNSQHSSDKYSAVFKENNPDDVESPSATLSLFHPLTGSASSSPQKPHLNSSCQSEDMEEDHTYGIKSPGTLAECEHAYSAMTSETECDKSEMNAVANKEISNSTITMDDKSPGLSSAGGQDDGNLSDAKDISSVLKNKEINGGIYLSDKDDGDDSDSGMHIDLGEENNASKAERTRDDKMDKVSDVASDIRTSDSDLTADADEPVNRTGQDADSTLNVAVNEGDESIVNTTNDGTDTMNTTSEFDTSLNLSVGGTKIKMPFKKKKKKNIDLLNQLQSSSTKDQLLADLNPCYKLPFESGWRREVVIRCVYDEIGTSGQVKQPPADVYYFPPTGPKLRSMVQISTYLKEHNVDLTENCFSFTRRAIYKSPEEVIRSAGARRGGRPSGGASSETLSHDSFEWTVQEKKYKKKSPKSAGKVGRPPKSGIPLPEVVIERETDEGYECLPFLGNLCNSPSKSLISSRGRAIKRKYSLIVSPPAAATKVNTPVTKVLSSAKGVKIKYTPVHGSTPNSTRTNPGYTAVRKERQATSGEVDQAPAKKLKVLTKKGNISHSKSGPARLCGLTCPDLMDLPPSLQCCLCLCLFHAECAGFVNRGEGDFICNACSGPSCKQPDPQLSTGLDMHEENQLNKRSESVTVIMVNPDGTQKIASVTGKPPPPKLLAPTTIAMGAPTIASISTLSIKQELTDDTLSALGLQAIIKPSVIAPLQSQVSIASLPTTFRNSALATSTTVSRPVLNSALPAMTRMILPLVATSTTATSPQMLLNGIAPGQKLIPMVNTTAMLNSLNQPLLSHAGIGLPNLTRAPVIFQSLSTPPSQLCSSISHISPQSSQIGVPRISSMENDDHPMITTLTPSGPCSNSVKQAISRKVKPPIIRYQVPAMPPLSLTPECAVAAVAVAPPSSAVPLTVAPAAAQVSVASLPLTNNSGQTVTQVGQLLSLPPGILKRLNRNEPLALKINNTQIIVPASSFIETDSGLKVCLPPSTFPTPNALMKVTLESQTNEGDKKQTIDYTMFNNDDSSKQSGTGQRGFDKLGRRAVNPGLCFIKSLHAGYEALTKVFKYLSSRDLLRASQVCKLWNKLSKDSAIWKHISLDGMNISSWQKVQPFLLRISPLSLDLRGVNYSGDTTSQYLHLNSMLSLLSSLRHVYLGAVPVSTIQTCYNLTGLHSLSAKILLDKDHGSLFGLAQLCRLQDLEVLELDRADESSLKGVLLKANLSVLGSLRNLKTLSLTAMSPLPGEDYTFLVNCPGLRVLRLADCSTWTNKSYCMLNTLTKLKRLRLERGGHTPDKGFADALLSLQELENMELLEWSIANTLTVALPLLARLKSLTVWPNTKTQGARMNTNMLRGLQELSTLTHVEWGVLNTDDAVPEPNSECIPIYSNEEDEDSDSDTENTINYINVFRLRIRLKKYLPNTKVLVYVVGAKPLLTSEIFDCDLARCKTGIKKGIKGRRPGPRSSKNAVSSEHNTDSEISAVVGVSSDVDMPIGKTDGNHSITSSSSSSSSSSESEHDVSDTEAKTDLDKKILKVLDDDDSIASNSENNGNVIASKTCVTELSAQLKKDELQNDDKSQPAITSEKTGNDTYLEEDMKQKLLQADSEGKDASRLGAESLVEYLEQVDSLGEDTSQEQSIEGNSKRVEVIDDHSEHGETIDKHDNVEGTDANSRLTGGTDDNSQHTEMSDDKSQNAEIIEDLSEVECIDKNIAQVENVDDDDDIEMLDDDDDRSHVTMSTDRADQEENTVISLSPGDNASLSSQKEMEQEEISDECRPQAGKSEVMELDDVSYDFTPLSNEDIEFDNDVEVIQKGTDIIEIMQTIASLDTLQGNTS